MPAHKNNTKTFPELPYDEQASSINAQIANVQSAIKHHIEHAPKHGKNSADVKDKCVKQIERLLDRVKQI